MTLRGRLSPLRAGVAAWILLAAADPALAEPYLAAQKGLKCQSCHFNPTGGGLRNAFGHAFAQSELAARRVDTGETQWLGEINRFISFGADFRGSATYTDVSGADDVDPAFALDELRAYLSLSVVPERLSLYLDQRLAPGNSRNLEAYGLLWIGDQRRYYVKAGQMVLPFGLRLEDDTAFIRQISGISFDTPDTGLELGLESGPWTAQLAVSNGSAGGAETNSGKQWSLRGEFVESAWRLGASYNYNDADDTERHSSGLFAALATGPVVWLAELDHVEDKGLPGGPLRQWVGLIEANWKPVQGHNLKATVEQHESDTDVNDDEQHRYSLVWEYAPIQYLQLRSGVRAFEGASAAALQEGRFVFAELHVFF